MNNELPDNLNEELAADLPAPREDEPSSLRRDIVDELADHLHCAVQREQFRTGAANDSHSQLWTRVLHRFGNPANIARKLWFDAMQEKIMSQRLTLVMLTFVVIGIGAMMFMLNRSLTASQEQQRLLAEQLLALTESLSNTSAPAPAAPSEWNNLSVKVVYDDEAKSPVVGATVSYEGSNDHTKSMPSDSAMSDAQGIADLGTVIYGEYVINVHAPNGIHLDRLNASVRPGEDKLVEVMMPRSTTVPVKFEIDHTLDEKVAETIDPERLWYRISISEGRPDRESPVRSSAELRNNYRYSLFVNSRGIIDNAQVEESFDRLAPDNRDISPANLEDQRIHRFAGERFLIPQELEYRKTAHVPISSSGNLSIFIYIEMEETPGGRRLLTSIPNPVMLDVSLWSESRRESEWERDEKLKYANTDGVQRDKLQNYEKIGSGSLGEYFQSQFDEYRMLARGTAILPAFDPNHREREFALSSRLEEIQMIALLQSVPLDQELVSLSVYSSISGAQATGQDVSLKPLRGRGIESGEITLRNVKIVAWQVDDSRQGASRNVLVVLDKQQIQAIQAVSKGPSGNLSRLPFRLEPITEEASNGQN